MKITIFTSNQPRHISLIEKLCEIADEVYAIQECNTVFPGQVDDFYRNSDVMRTYFEKLLSAEYEIFGQPRFAPANSHQIALRFGDLNRLALDNLEPALNSDVYLVFGCSYIKGPLCDFLVSRKTYNVHMGLSPFYRGNSCNFWALYDKRPEYVGATIHLLTKGLDSGPMIFHALPKPCAYEPFALGMSAVRAAQDGICQMIKSGEISSATPVYQDRSEEIRYTRKEDFSDQVAREYLQNTLTPQEIQSALEIRDNARFLRAYIG